MSEVSHPERVSENFSRALFLEARTQAWKALKQVISHLKPGLTQKQVVDMCETELKERGFEKNWHRTRVEFGPNTLCTFKDRSNPETVLRENDLVFFDLGPVWKGHEADIGTTVCLGNDPEHLRCAQDVQLIFQEVTEIWKTQHLTGPALYEQAEKRARAKGWILNTSVDGHRLGDFPHVLHFRGGLNDIDFCPKDTLWVLEIQIRHPDLPFGAFYEDLLSTMDFERPHE